MQTISTPKTASQPRRPKNFIIHNLLRKNKELQKNMSDAILDVKQKSAENSMNSGFHKKAQSCVKLYIQKSGKNSRTLSKASSPKIDKESTELSNNDDLQGVLQMTFSEQSSKITRKELDKIKYQKLSKIYNPDSFKEIKEINMRSLNSESSNETLEKRKSQQSRRKVRKPLLSCPINITDYNKIPNV